MEKWSSEEVYFCKKHYSFTIIALDRRDISNFHFKLYSNIFKMDPLKSLKILWKWLSAIFSFAFYVFSNSSNCLFEDRIYFILLRNILKQSWKSFNIKFQPQWQDRIIIYQVRQFLALFCNLIALILGLKCVKGVELQKLSKKLSLKGAWVELQAKN